MADIESLLRDYLNYLEIEKNRSPKTRENYERYLKAFVKSANIKTPKDITEEKVRDFRLKIARGSPFDRFDAAYHKSARGQRSQGSLKKITQSYYIIAIRNFLKYLSSCLNSEI